MKVHLSRRVFTLALAVLIGGAMSPRILHGQSQSTTTTNSSTSSRAAKRKAKKEAKKEAKEKKAAERKAAAAQPSAAASASNGTAASNQPSARAERRSHEAAASQPVTPPAPGMVWVNTSTKVYHKAGSRWAGKTKNGKWMTEADAQKAGYKPAKN